MLDIETIVTIVTAMAGGSGIAGIIVAINARKRSKADAVKVIEEATSTLIKHYRDDNESIRLECHGLRQEVEDLTCRLDNDVDECRREISTLKEEVKTLQLKNIKLMSGIERLIHQVRSRGDMPVINPDEYFCD
jgi:hypothetical protein